MARIFARMCSICKEDHVILDSTRPTDGNVCICERCFETVAKDNVVWICLSCRQVYLESKKLLLERESDPDIRRCYRNMLSECVIQGLETCLNCCGKAAYDSAGAASALLCC